MSEVATQYESVDFSDVHGQPAHIKAVVLQAARLEAQLQKSGRVELTSNTLYFIADQTIRASLAALLQGSVSLDLGEEGLPLLYRAALLEAYLQEKLTEGLLSLGEIDIAPNAYERKVLSERKGGELFEQLRGRIANPGKKEGVRELTQMLGELEASAESVQFPLELYEAVFGQTHGEGIAAIGRSLLQGNAETQISVPPAQSLQADHLGGRSQIDMMMHWSTRPQYTQRAEEVCTNDRVRWILGGSKGEKSHHIRTYTSEWYRGLNPLEQRYVNTIVLRNLADALCVDSARALFPKEIPANVYMTAMAQNGFGFGTELGVRDGGGGHCTLDTDPKKPLDAVAMGAQAVLDAYRSISTQSGLIMQDQSQVASAGKRRRENVSFLSLFGGTGNYARGNEYGKEIIAKNLWEYLDIAEDTVAQEKFYQAFGRLFGKSYKGTTPEESWTHAEICLKRDGTVTCRYVDDAMYPEDSDPEAWDLFAAVQKGADGWERVDYVRRGYFHPNIPDLIASLQNEIQSFDVLLAEAKTVSGEASVRMEKSLLWDMNGEVEKRILEARERLSLLQEYLTPNTDLWLSELELTTLPGSPDDVRNAYRIMVRKLNAHPDQHNDDPVRREQAVGDFKRLTRARDELLLQVGNRGKTGMSAYVGRPMDILERTSSDQ